MKNSRISEPLTDYEAILFYRLVHNGTGGYPIGQNRKNKKFFVPTLISEKTFDSFRSASEAIEAWTNEAEGRFKEMKKNHPGLRLAADGIHFLPEQDMGMPVRPGPEESFDFGGES